MTPEAESFGGWEDQLAYVRQASFRLPHRGRQPALVDVTVATITGGAVAPVSGENGSHAQDAPVRGGDSLREWASVHPSSTWLTVPRDHAATV